MLVSRQIRQRKKSKEYQELQDRIKVSPIDSDLMEFGWAVYRSSHKDSPNELYYATRVVVVDKKATRYRLHRIVMERILGRKLSRNELVDHIDCDGLNNTRENLRIASHGQNIGRMRLRRNNKSGNIGVHWNQSHGGWVASIHSQNRTIVIGVYKEKIQAIIAYDAVLSLVRGKWMRATVFPDGENPLVINRDEIFSMNH